METGLFSENDQIALIILSGIALMFMMGIMLLLFFYFSKKKIVQKELEKKNVEIIYQKKLLRSILEAQEKERKRIAADLHDDISSKLNIVFLNCELLSMKNLSGNKEKEVIGTIAELSGKVLENSRNIAHNLFPPVFNKFGLDAGVEELCAEFNRTHKVKVDFQNHVEFNPNEKERHLHVFRILQELMNNSLRHGKASNINILFKQKGKKTACEYCDNGTGFDLENNDHKIGLGLRNIESRIDFLNGKIQIDSKLGIGTNVTFEF